MQRPRPQPNPKSSLANHLASEFLSTTTELSTAMMNRLILANAHEGGSLLGFSYEGILFSHHDQVHKRTEFVEEIHESLKTVAQALYLRCETLRAMQLKLQQALVTIIARCRDDYQTIYDALPDEFRKGTQLETMVRVRPMSSLLKANPMLNASYRVIDEAIAFRNMYRLLDR